MSHDLEKKLALLREEYARNLPGKIEEIEKIWLDLNLQWEEKVFSELYRKIHSLHGSAKIYGYSDIGKKASDTEIFLNILHSKTLPTLEQKTQLEHMLQELKHLTLQGEIPLAQQFYEASSVAYTEKIVYLLDNDRQWADKFIPQVATFGYKIRFFDSIDLFFAAICRDHPPVLCMNIDLVSRSLENGLLEFKQNYQDTSIIFISAASHFTNRLKAVRLGGQAYLKKPFSIEDLVTQIDHFFKTKNEIYRILIVDDEVDVANYHAAILSHVNMAAHIVTEAAEVIRALEAFKPDLVLMDLYMPECSGTELAAIIRQQSAYESIPIIFLSSEKDKLKQLNAMRLGADDFVTKSMRPKYLILTIMNRANRYKILHSMMVRDYLTGIYNHSFMQRQLDIELSQATCKAESLCVAMIDIDSFKIINDTYGHQAGDEVLRSLGLMMRKRMRDIDFVGRYGGEEFIILMPNTDLSHAFEIIDELRKQFIILTYSVGSKIFNATFSAGVAAFPDFSTATSLIKAADDALYQSKKYGKNRVEKANIS